MSFSLSLLPPPLPLQLSFSLISTFFCRSSVVSIDSPTTQERSRNSLKIILRNDNRILHASKKKEATVEYIRINSCRGIVTFAKNSCFVFVPNYLFLNPLTGLRRSFSRICFPFVFFHCYDSPPPPSPLCFGGTNVYRPIRSRIIVLCIKLSDFSQT